MNPLRRKNFTPNSGYDFPETTKVTIHNLMLSVSNDEIESTLKGLGCSQFETQYDCKCDEDNMLITIKNGNRRLLANRDQLKNNHQHFVQTDVLGHITRSEETCDNLFNCLKTGHTYYECKESPHREIRSMTQLSSKVGKTPCQTSSSVIWYGGLNKSDILNTAMCMTKQ